MLLLELLTQMVSIQSLPLLPLHHQKLEAEALQQRQAAYQAARQNIEEQAKVIKAKGAEQAAKKRKGATGEPMGVAQTTSTAQASSGSVHILVEDKDKDSTPGKNTKTTKEEAKKGKERKQQAMGRQHCQRSTGAS